MQLDIDELRLTDFVDIATSYTNIGFVYANMHLFSQSLINLEKALDILLKQLPVNHPDIEHIYFLRGHIKRAFENISYDT
ncbi:unnamed protein product [Rotaria sp. Silwood2]|nr:unnamed protein product [Rotaria sp. Silwood2]CAF4419319.1 unnamed protein product [Rotaria sp. Silwood2]